MTVEQRRIVDRELWLQWRREFVTAWEIAALFDCHPFLSPLKLFMSKQDVEFPNNETIPMRRGRLLEPAVALAIEEERPAWRGKLIKGETFYSDSESRIGATPDYLIDDDGMLGILQCKTCLPSVYERDWNCGETVPQWIELQTLTEMMMVGANFGVVGCLRMDDFTCSIHPIDPNPVRESAIINAVRKFWRDVELGIEPDPDYQRDSAVIKLIAPRESAPDKTIDLSGNNHLPTLLEEFTILQSSIKHDEKRCEEIKTFIKFAMRDAAVVAGLPDWRITWKTEHHPEHRVRAHDRRPLKIQYRGTHGKD